ncbi:hypothetical protein MPC4_250055 [Methylocella tundrae]|uniref:Uncharacterized protein n=1 Tax=Methylocella tundrae TaxID=227605 RepID=A0A8B6M6W7_METTU|nr:hypothetical protein MPC4_250055 [Methylocella tundrae]
MVKKAVPAKKPEGVAKKQSAASVRASSAKPAAVKAAAPQTTITLKQNGAQLAEAHELPKQQVEAIFSDMIDSIIKHLKKGRKSSHQRNWNFAGQKARSPDGAQSGDGREHQDQGEQDGEFASWARPQSQDMRTNERPAPMAGDTRAAVLCVAAFRLLLWAANRRSACERLCCKADMPYELPPMSIVIRPLLREALPQRQLVELNSAERSRCIA